MSKTWEEKMTPKLLGCCLNGFLELDTEWINTGTNQLLTVRQTHFFEDKNLICFFGRMESHLRKYIEHMRRHDWIFDEERAKKYEFPKV